MKKIVILLSLVILLTGCSIKEIDKSSIDKIVKSAIKENISLYNVYDNGYKYYLPKGMNIADKEGYNTKILYKDNKYYLYIDFVSYYHKSDVEYEDNSDYYFYEKLDYNGKVGYIKIDNSEKNDRYFLEIMYNYAKIEAYVDKENIEQAIINTINLLASVKINDAVLETLIGENILNYTEEKIDTFESRREEGAFLEVAKEYDKWEEPKEDNKDEDVILPDNNE